MDTTQIEAAAKASAQATMLPAAILAADIVTTAASDTGERPIFKAECRHDDVRFVIVGGVVYVECFGCGTLWNDTNVEAFEKARARVLAANSNTAAPRPFEPDDDAWNMAISFLQACTRTQLLAALTQPDHALRDALRSLDAAVTVAQRIEAECTDVIQRSPALAMDEIYKASVQAAAVCTLIACHAHSIRTLTKLLSIGPAGITALYEQDTVTAVSKLSDVQHDDDKNFDLHP